jgi:hypothetical protein
MLSIGWTLWIVEALGLLVLIICKTKTIFYRLFCYATLVGMFVIFMGVGQ